MPEGNAGKFELKQARLGRAPPGATLVFTIGKSKGVSVNALLERDMQHVAAWESIEIAGRTTQEPLIPTGVYTLQVSVAYRGTEPAEVVMDFGIHSGDRVLSAKQLRFSGSSRDIGRALAVVRIEKS